MKRIRLFWLFVIIVGIMMVSITACGDDDDEEDDGGAADDDDDGGGSCSTMPDMVINNFTFYETDGFFGTDFSFTEIMICNNGGIAAEAGSVLGLYLVVNADFTGEFYIVETSEPLVGFAAGDCLTFTLNATSSEAPEGYYYVYIVADSNDVIAECNESNNWARSAEAVYVKPNESESV